MRYIVLSAIALSAPVFAQEAAPEIVVTGRGIGGGAGDRAYDVVAIERERLEDVASGRLEDVLRDAAGFQQFRRSDSRSANPTSQGATLRGLGGNASSRALALLDGVPLTDPFGGWLSFSAIDPRRLGLVRVTRGGGTGVNGPGALAGTIELSSASPDQLSPVWGDLAYGSRDSFSASGGVLFQSGPGFATLFGSYDRGDGFIPIVRESRGPADRPAPYRQWSAGARAVIAIAPDTELQASGLAFYDRRDRGLAFTGNRNQGIDGSLRLVGNGRWRWEALAYLQTRDFTNQASSVNAARTTSTLTLDQYSVPATGFGGRLEVRPPLGSGAELRIGADARGTDGSTNEFYTYVAGAPTRIRHAGGRTTTAGAFLEGTLTPTDALTLTAGGRIDRWWIEDGRLLESVIATGAPLTNSRFANRAGWEPTGRAGITYRPAGAVTVRAAGYIGWRLPTLNELFRPFRAGADATAANPLLSPETMRGFDGGIDYRPLSNTRVGLTLFWNRLDDAIANVTLGKGPGTFPGVGFVGAGGSYRQRQNLNSIRSRGVELDAEARLAQFRLSASYAYVDARVHAAGAATVLNGLRPAQVPRHQASGTIAWDGRFAQASATLRYVAAQYEDDLNARALNDAVTLDATLAVPLRPGLAIEGRAENIGNARVEATVSDAGVVERASPRTLWIGLRFGGR